MHEVLYLLQSGGHKKVPHGHGARHPQLWQVDIHFHLDVVIEAGVLPWQVRGLGVAATMALAAQ